MFQRPNQRTKVTLCFKLLKHPLLPRLIHNYRLQCCVPPKAPTLCSACNLPTKKPPGRSLWDAQDAGNGVPVREVDQQLSRIPHPAWTLLCSCKTSGLMSPPAAFCTLVTVAVGPGKEFVPLVSVCHHGSWPNLAENMKALAGTCHFGCVSLVQTHFGQRCVLTTRPSWCRCRPWAPYSSPEPKEGIFSSDSSKELQRLKSN